MTTALYRRYRPDTFVDVVGQDHVTEPLQQALRADKVNHAYLFSGPRGCGKTTSARILARCLNCETGPTDSPCGHCDSCQELATGGPGSMDVVEIDAASHNGVDDARDLRERAAFAPARDRYKIFILDEAHMVTPQGFNALLKLVEEPPPHVRFIFATTEPEKVIGTIRSRTHHYPFRLVPPDILVGYLAQVCQAEDVQVESGVLALVVRAGGGSVRDSLSVLDQLIGGSDDRGVTYDRAIALLGFTDATLLDDAVDALAAADGASLFDVVSRVIATGHEPRRFVEDLLDRLRDLLLIAASGQAGARALGELPEDQRARMLDQARHLGLARASRAGDLINEALTHMVGATSPRLHLELLCARLIAADNSGTLGGVAASGSQSQADAATARQAVSAARQHAADAARQPVAEGAKPPAQPPVPTEEPGRAPVRETAPVASTPDRPAPTRSTPTPTEAIPTTPTAGSAPATVTPPTASAGTPTVAGPATGSVSTAGSAGGPEDTELIRRRWTEVLGTLERRRVTWSMVSQSAQVATVDMGVLVLAFDNAALAGRFAGGQHAENVALAVRETLGLQVRVEAREQSAVPSGATSSIPVVSTAETSMPPAVGDAPVAASPDQPGWESEPPPDDHDTVSEHDEKANELSGADVVAQMLGGTVIED